MRKKGSQRFFRGCFFTVALLFVCFANAQEGVSLNRKKTTRPSLHAGVLTPATDTTIASQPLFSILKQLNQSKGIYFLFSDKAFGEILVKPVVIKNQSTEQLLEELLQQTGLKFKKINDRTFVIIAAPAIPVNVLLNKQKLEDELKNTISTERKGQL